MLVLSGTGSPDPELTAVSTVSPAVIHEATAYLQAGGRDNLAQLLRLLADHLLLTGFGHTPPVVLPQHGVYQPDPHGAAASSARPTVGILFYRSHWMSGNLAFVDALVRELNDQGLNALPVFTASLKDLAPDDCQRGAGGQWPAAFEHFYAGERCLIDVLLTTVSFALGDVQADGPTHARLVGACVFQVGRGCPAGDLRGHGTLAVGGLATRPQPAGHCHECRAAGI